MSSEVVISLDGVGKSYPSFDKPYQRLLHTLLPGRQAKDEFQALRNVSLQVRRGEAIGIIGKNGSGKSTMLQIIAGIVQPSSGVVRTHARISALLELGAGFNPEFTGRENIGLNASLLGLSAAQIAERMDQIIAFAEIGDHIEQQVKTYSSGMFVRLAFAVAVHTDPDVLIVDEALSVGDIYFQRKCHKRIEQMRQQGCTLLFVTHAIDSMLRLCDRGVLLERGELVFDGEAKLAVKEYLRRLFGDNSPDTGDDGANDAAAFAQENTDDDELTAFLNGGHVDRFASRPGYNRDETRVGEGSAVTCDYLISSSHGYGPLVAARAPFKLYVRYSLPNALDRLIFGVRVCTVTGAVVYSSNTFVSSGQLYACEPGTVAIAEFDLRCSLLRGHYFVTVGVSRFDQTGSEIVAIDRRADSIVLNVLGDNTHAEGLADLEASISIGDRGIGRIRVLA
ncbi:MAG: ABC transporter ATP-binding protein [Luteimonas sp.]|nr:ABC transporter ATP-binding protein [Luteimonas sp.]